MEETQRVAGILKKVVGERICMMMAEKYINKYMKEKDKTEFTEEDLNSSDFGSWLVKSLEHLSMIRPQALKDLESELMTLN